MLISHTATAYPTFTCKVIIEKSRGEGSLMEQDTIENVSQPKFFFLHFKKKKKKF